MDRVVFYWDDVKERVKVMEFKVKEWKESMMKVFGV